MLIHLLELRRRALYVLCFFTLLFFIFFFIATDLYHILVHPLVRQLPQQAGLIATQITAPVLTPLKIAADTALLFSVPFFLYQLWCFIRPGLYHQEQQAIKGALIMSVSLFVLGGLFCFFIVLPLMFQFFIQALPKQVQFMPDMSHAVTFITHMIIVFGLCFQVPLLCVLFVRLHWVDLATLKKIRPYIIVAAFILGMLLTPPDVLSQVILAVPLCALYELGILIVSLSSRNI